MGVDLDDPANVWVGYIALLAVFGGLAALGGIALVIVACTWRARGRVARGDVWVVAILAVLAIGGALVLGVGAGVGTTAVYDASAWAEDEIGAIVDDAALLGDPDIADAADEAADGIADAREVVDDYQELAAVVAYVPAMLSFVAIVLALVIALPLSGRTRRRGTDACGACVLVVPMLLMAAVFVVLLAALSAGAQACDDASAVSDAQDISASRWADDIPCVDDDVVDVCDPLLAQAVLPPGLPAPPTKREAYRQAADFDTTGNEQLRASLLACARFAECGHAVLVADYLDGTMCTPLLRSFRTAAAGSALAYAFLVLLGAAVLLLRRPRAAYSEIPSVP